MFAVLPWQRRFIRGAFAPGIQSAALSVGRGNGKTALLSGIACATLDGPLHVPRGEIVTVASSFEQARIAFEHVVAFMGDKLADKRRWKVWDTAQQARIEDRETGARVRCIGNDPRRAHGLAPVLVLADEPGAGRSDQSGDHIDIPGPRLMDWLWVIPRPCCRMCGFHTKSDSMSFATCADFA